jgi:hypothetical protein
MIGLGEGIMENWMRMVSLFGRMSIRVVICMKLDMFSWLRSWVERRLLSYLNMKVELRGMVIREGGRWYEV